MQSKISFKVDGLMIAVLVGVAGLAYLAYKRKEVIAAINPADERNLVNQAVIGLVGQETVTDVGDKVFAAIDLINPFNESDDYARMVYGLDGERAAPAK